MVTILVGPNSEIATDLLTSKILTVLTMTDSIQTGQLIIADYTILIKNIGM